VLKHVWLILLALLVAGCGPSKQEWEAQLDKYNTLNRENEQEKAAHAATRAELEQTQQKVLRLSNQLKQMGVDMDALAQQLEAEGTEKAKLAASLQELRQALEEYKARAAQLERIKNRFEALKAKLKKLTDLGLRVEIRNNRMVIRLPGDVLFASGSTKLEDKGKEVILAVCEVIRKDPDLAKRYYQVAGHTDDKPFNNYALKDNWGLSVMRARSVLVYMIAPVDAKGGGGGLDPKHLHAAGYGSTDPAEKGDTDEARQQNRRVELVVMPDVSEMLDLQNL